VRSEFDDILLRHASTSGAAVFEQVKVTSIRFKNDDPTKLPIAAEYENKATSETGTIRFDFLVDASGRNGIISQRYLKDRKFNKSLNNVAVWGYWKGCKRYSPGTNRENAIWIEALQGMSCISPFFRPHLFPVSSHLWSADESGWAWFIPLHDGTVSVGVVQDQTRSGAKKRALRDCTGESTLTSHYLHELKLAPGVLKYIGEEATLVEVGKDGGSGVKQAADFSYSAGAYARPGYRLVGDAAGLWSLFSVGSVTHFLSISRLLAFIDPFFSSGVHLAFTGGLAAAATIASSIRGDTCEEECAKWHDAKIGTAYTR
jgi:flavine halogenase